MALFEGEEMVNVTTPDGRTLTLPRSIVPSSVLAQQQIGQATTPPPTAPGISPMPSTMNAIPEAPVESITGGKLELPGSMQQAPTDVPPVQNAPDYVAGVIDQDALAKQAAAQQKAQAAQQKTAAAQAATPAGKVAAATNEGKKAIEEQRAAAISAADIDAAGQALTADAYEKRNQDLDKLFEKRKTEAEADLAQQNQKLAEMEGLKKRIAGAKIDRTADHPILAGIGIVLAGLGSAMKHQDTNPALDAFYKAIDRKVAGQMQDLDQAKTVLGFTKDELAELRNTAQSKLALNNILIAGESEKAAKQVEAIAARSSSEKTKANAQIFAAQLRERSAALTMDAVKYQNDYDQKERHQKEQIGLGYANLAETRRAHIASEQIDRERIAADLEKALAAEHARGGEAAMKAKMEMMKDNETRGIRNVVDKQPLLTKAGREAMDQATQMEQQASQIDAEKAKDQLSWNMMGGDEKAKQLREQASVLRGNAMITGQVRARDPNQAGQIGKQWAASQSMIQLVDEIRDLYDKEGRGYVLTTPEQEALQAKTALLALKGKEAWQLGAWDKGAERITDKISTLNPTSGWDVGVLGAALNRERIKNPEGFKKRLDAVAHSLQQDMENNLSTNTTWDDSGKLFSRSQGPDLNTPEAKASQALMKGRTPSEVAGGLRKSGGVAGWITDRFRFVSREDQARAAEESGSARYLGLGAEQEKPFDTLLQSYKKGSADAGKELIAHITNTADSRPELSVALLENLQQYAPDLYKQARAAMPQGSKAAEKIGEAEKSRIGASQTPTEMLRMTVINSIDKNGKVSDEEGRNELARRASYSLSPEEIKKLPLDKRLEVKAARDALLEIVNQSGVNSSTPQGSVFREGR